MKLIDSHCHLDSEQFNADREAVIQRAFDAGVEHMMAIGAGYGISDLESAIHIADRHDAVSATIGVHPHDASKAAPETFRRLAELTKHPKVLAIGETGLDFHYDHSPRDIQRSVFIEQMRIANDARKPIVIHTRSAWEDTYNLLVEHWKPTGLSGILHCFSEGPKEAEQAVELGFYVSFAGIVTFPKAHSVQEAAKIVPMERMLIETDAPFLAPVPKRGKRNEPALVVETAKKIAELRGISAEEVAAVTAENFWRLTAPKLGRD